MTAPLTNWRELHKDFFANQRVLVTGGAGFIGSHLVEALSTLGSHVTVIDDLSGGDRANLAGFANVEFHQGSILDQDLLLRCTRGRRFVFHLAALGSVPLSVEQPRRYNDVNTTGTLNVLETARTAGAERLMFSASSSAYGDNPVPWIETMPPAPKSPYAATKLAGEGLLGAYAASYSLDTVSLRYFNIFGPRQNANSAYAAVIAAFAKAYAAGQHPLIYGDGEQTRDFTFVHNAVHANLLAACNPRPLAGTVINVGCGAAVSVNRLATLMAKMMNRTNLPATHRPERAGDLKHSYADLARAKALLSYAPIVSFEKGLEETVRWYEKVLK